MELDWFRSLQQFKGWCNWLQNSLSFQLINLFWYFTFASATAEQSRWRSRKSKTFVLNPIIRNIRNSAGAGFFKRIDTNWSSRPTLPSFHPASQPVSQANNHSAVEKKMDLSVNFRVYFLESYYAWNKCCVYLILKLRWTELQPQLQRHSSKVSASSSSKQLSRLLFALMFRWTNNLQ